MADTIPLLILTPPPTIDSELTSLTVIPLAICNDCAYRVVAVRNPETFTFPPTTSMDSVGIVVPIPTKPVGLTIKLSLSTWTPLRKLNCLL